MTPYLPADSIGISRLTVSAARTIVLAVRARLGLSSVHPEEDGDGRDAIGPIRCRRRVLGVACAVIAPALPPRRPGQRIKTDRRDAAKLVRLFRAGELAAIHVLD